MKKLLFIFFPILFFSQNTIKDSTFILLRIDHESNLYRSYNQRICFGSDRVYLSEGDEDLFFVTNTYNCEKKIFIGGFYLGEFKYLEADKPYNLLIRDDPNFYNIQKIDSVFNASTNIEKDKLYEFSKFLSFRTLLKRKDKLFADIMSFQKYPIAILKSVPTSEDPFTGASFQIMNFSSKTIKYAKFNFYGKNAVNDKVLYKPGVYNITRQGIGPVEKYATGSWNFETVWMTDIVETLKLISVTITYMDNTVKTVPVTDAMWLDPDKITEWEKLTVAAGKIEELQ